MRCSRKLSRPLLALAAPLALAFSGCGGQPARLVSATAHRESGLYSLMVLLENRSRESLSLDTVTLEMTTYDAH